jgi:hypothetical protein
MLLSSGISGIASNGNPITIPGGPSLYEITIGGAQAVVSGGAVTAVNVTNGGSGYTTARAVVFAGGGGSGAAATAVLSNGVITGITVTNGGSGYTSAPTVYLMSNVSPGLPAINVIQGTVSAIAYSIDTVNNPNTAYFGTNQADLWYRTTPGATFQPRGRYKAVGGAGVVEIVVDPYTSATAYVLDGNGRVWQTGDGGGTWDELTGDLGIVARSLTTLALCDPNPIHAGQGALVVGGFGGVYSLRLDSGTLAWQSVGQGLPTVRVTDVHYVSPQDLLVVGTFGRGAWIMPGASAALLNPPRTDISVSDDDATQNQIVIASVAGFPGSLQILVNNRVEYTGPSAYVSSIAVNESPASDTVDIEANSSTPITVNIGPGTDVVNIDLSSRIYNITNFNPGLGPSTDVTVHGESWVNGTLNVYDQNGPAGRSWTVTDSQIYNSEFFGAAVDFDHLRSINLYGGPSATYTINGTSGTPELGTTIVGGSGTNTFAVQVTNAPLTIDGNGSQDAVNVVESVTTLNNLAGLVTVNGNGHTNFTLDDSAVRSTFLPLLGGITYQPGPTSYVLNRPPSAVGDLMLTRSSKTLVTHAFRVIEQSQAAFQFNTLASLTVKDGSEVDDVGDGSLPIHAFAVTDTGGIGTTAFDINSADAQATVGDANNSLDPIGTLILDARGSSGGVQAMLDDEAVNRTIDNEGFVSTFQSNPGLPSYTITNQTVQRVNQGTESFSFNGTTYGPQPYGPYSMNLTYYNLQSLNLTGGPTGNVFNVQSKYASTFLGITGGSGGDTVNVSGANGALDIVAAASVHIGTGTLQNVPAVVTIEQPLFPQKFTSVEVDDSADPNPVTATLHSALLNRSGVLLPAAELDMAGAEIVTDLSVSWTIDGPAQAANKYTVNGTSNDLTVLKPGLGTVQVNSTEGELHIQGGQHVIVGNGRFKGFPAGGDLIGGQVIVTNPAGNGLMRTIDLTVDDSLDMTGRTIGLTASNIVQSVITGLSSSEIEFNPYNLTALTIKGGGGGNTFYLQPSAAGTTLTVEAGSGGDTVNLQGAAASTATTVNVRATAAGTTTTINANAGSDTINVGSDPVNLPLSRLDPIQGAVTVNGQGGNTTLNVHDDGNPVSENYTVSPTTIQRSIIVAGVYNFNIATITYNTVGHVAVYVGSARMGVNEGALNYNTLDVVGTLPGTVTDVFGNNNGGQTAFSVAPYISAPTSSYNPNNQILGRVQVHGSSIGLDTLTYYDYLDQTAQSYTMTAGQMVDNGFAPVTYDGLFYGVGLVTSVVGKSTVSVRSTAAIGFGTQVQTNPGDVVIVGTQVPNRGGTLAGLAPSGRLEIQTTDGNPRIAATVILDDSADTQTGKQVTFNTDSYGWGVSGLAPQGIYIFLGTGSSVQVLGGSPAAGQTGGNTYAIQSVPAGVSLTLTGGTGTDTLHGPDTANTWQITGANAGTLNQTVTFTSIQNLTGGAANDAFAFQTGGSLSGTLDGGGGSNTLDYSSYTGDITVDLPLGMATGFARISNIENVTGSIGNDLLVGDANPNTLRGGTGRNLIIGGAGADQLFGGNLDNILIAGYTLYDQQPGLVALHAFMTEWTSSDTYDMRVKKISNGVVGSDGNTYALVGGKGKSQTVFDDGATDVLTCTPNTDPGVLDWLLANTTSSGGLDQILNPKKKDNITQIF